ncbi:MAG TPA: hydratase, partial [Oribacterium sp.]|nr:hydratase [Oribacterium sp.]
HGHANPDAALVKGPNIADWPEMAPLKENLLLKVAGSYHGSVTTDELVPSGEASSYRSNPEKISGFTMISRDPQYVPTAKAIRAIEAGPNLEHAPKNAQDAGDPSGVTFGSMMVSDQIGDGSSREQAASCQKVLGGFANLANEYSTKRYRSNLINWGLLPLRTEEKLQLPQGSYVYIEGIRTLLREGGNDVELRVLDSSVKVELETDVRALTPEELKAHTVKTIHATLDSLTNEEREILMSGCLINHYKND